MTRLLPPLHEGHAPIFLHQAFDDALDAYEDWATDQFEPQVHLEGRTVPISSVLGRMRACTDVVPARTLETVRAVLGSDALGSTEGQTTYSEVASLMRAIAVERLRA